MSKFEGAFTALITPFNKDLSIDKEALRELVEFQIEEGISGLVPVGTTGESPTLSHKEHIEVIRIVVDQVKKRGTGHCRDRLECHRGGDQTDKERQRCGGHRKFAGSTLLQ